MELLTLWRRFLDVLFPAVCAACRSSLSAHSADFTLCEQCRSRIVLLHEYHCPTCRGRIPFSETGRVPAKNLRCHPRAEYLLYAAAHYEDPALQALIKELKFNRRESIAKDLGLLLARGLASSVSDIDYVIPLPLAKQRLRERGFNQAELIAKICAQELALQVNTDVLLRLHHKKAQSTLKSWKQREENIAGAFVVRDNAPIQGKRILLIDDVWTSGATMNEAARVLREAGAKDILAAVIARAS